MLSRSTIILKLLIYFILTNTLFSQNFKIVKEDKSFILIEFSIDSSKMNKIVSKKENVDFTKYFYCLNQNNKPIVPLFNYNFRLKDSSLSYKIEFIDSILKPIKSIKTGLKNKKRGLTSNFNNDNENQIIKLNNPFIYREFIGQNLQITPIKFDSISSQIIYYNKILIKIFFKDKFLTIPNISEKKTVYISSNLNFYDFNKDLKKTKSLNPTVNELLIICKDTNENIVKILANWKNQKGIKTTILKLNTKLSPEDLKSKIITYHKSIPNLKYVLIIGNHDEIPAYNYGNIDGDNYYSDSYYGQLTNDLYPELFIGRITGTSDEIKSFINKSIYYEKENFDGNWMIKSAGIGSNEGIGEGDQGEADWEHLRKIKNKLYNFGFSEIYEFYDGDHGIDDKAGSPNKTDILEVINNGISLLNYTGHGDDNLMLTGQLSSNDLKELTNDKKNPFIVSVACDNGKFTNGQSCLAEYFNKCKDENTYTGSIAFCGSSILMDWAPPMLTQDEIINSIISNDTLENGYSIGELFYNSQAKMLNKYNSLGNGVMQTWILFGDPSIELKTKIPNFLEYKLDYVKKDSQLIINCETDKINMGISNKNNYLSSKTLNKGLNVISIDTSLNNILVTLTKPNYITKQIYINTNDSTNLLKNELDKEYIIFPNPLNKTNSKINIKSKNSIESISLNDIFGNEIKSYELNSNEISLDFPSNISSGIYFIKIKPFNTNNILIKKISIY